MVFFAGPVSVSVPATSANLGPGFDCLGLALDLRDTLTAEVYDGPLARVPARCRSTRVTSWYGRCRLRSSSSVRSRRACA
jgi:hypothetical protein